MRRRWGFMLVAVCVTVPFVVAPARADTLRSVYHVPTVGGAHVRVEVERDPTFDPQPVILTYSPYGINDDAFLNRPRVDNLSERYVPLGYARAWADVLGTRGSSGCWDYGGLAEQQSGVDLVNYLAGLEWSNGRSR